MYNNTELWYSSNHEEGTTLLKTKGHTMKTNTKYTARINGTDTDFSRSTKATVVAHVEALRKGGEEGLLEVVTATGHVAFALAPVKHRVITRHTKPFTKTVEVPAALRKLVLKGYEVAYTRPANDTAVLRSKKAPKTEAYVVTRLTTGAILGYAETTRGAGAIQKAQNVKLVAANA